MSEQEPKAIPTQLNIRFADASNLPIQHVNAIAVNNGSDEFYFTLGVVVPPDQEEIKAAIEAGYVVAQPVFRFAVSRNSMEKFIDLMVQQYDQQTAIINELQGHRIETSTEEVSKNE